MIGEFKNVMKGRATETVFEEMFGNKDRYRVLHFGFEYVSPELTQAVRDKTDPTFKMISKTPDFILHDLEEKRLYLVEAKYRTSISKSEVLKTAEILKERGWNLSKLFIASTDGFYYDDVENIIKNGGICCKLSEDVIPKMTQEKYLSELNSLFL